MLLLYLFLDDGRCDTANHCIILLYFLYRTNFSGDGNQTAGGEDIVLLTIGMS